MYTRKQMKRHYYSPFFPVVVVTLLFLIFLSPLAGHDDKLFYLRKEVAREERDLRGFTDKIQKLEKNMKNYAARHRRRMASGQKTIAGLKDDLLKLKRELQHENISLAREKAAINEFKKNAVALKKRLLAVCDRRAKHIAGGFPAHRQERRRVMTRLRADAREGTLSAEEFYSRLSSALYRDILRGFDAEVYLFENRKYLRVGWILLACFNPATGRAELLTRRGGTWKWITSPDTGFRRTIEGAIKMVEGKEAPDLVNFPAPASLIKSALPGGRQ